MSGRVEDGSERWRTFCAVEIPEDVRARAAAHAARLRQGHARVRASWDKPEKLHVTLKFLGEIEKLRVDDLQRAAGRAVMSVEPFMLALEGTGAFPTRGLPRVLWLGVRDDAGGLARLQRRLEDECEREGFAREPRDFHPHITIARLRAPEGARQLAEAHCAEQFSAEPFAVTELLLIRSELGPGGSRYTTLSRHELKSN